jgi:hypothetical protein
VGLQVVGHVVSHLVVAHVVGHVVSHLVVAHVVGQSTAPANTELVATPQTARTSRSAAAEFISVVSEKV